MSDIAIKVTNLSKRYRIGLKEEIHDSLGGAFTSWIKSPISNFKRVQKLSAFNHDNSDDIIWAVKDVSFEVKQGEVLGIIGKNGAGKSTLLKILARITDPTSGTAEINGRVASLLEVGTGFHRELTGRENVYLNGTILGMTKNEIQRNFDEIVDFSGIEKFIDTPVKRYSSGMTVRLAFAVAAHLQPEILLIDEVLAVGDTDFQKKCLGKMKSVAGEGRTVLFVSHNMIAIQGLCGRVLSLKDGKVLEDGEPNDVVANYLQTTSSIVSEKSWNDIQSAPGNEAVRIHRVAAYHDHKSPYSLYSDNPITIEVCYWNQVPDAKLHVTLHFHFETGVTAFTSGSSRDPYWRGRNIPKGLIKSKCTIPKDFLNRGIYTVDLLIIQDGSKTAFRLDNILELEILENVNKDKKWFGREPGVVRGSFDWSTEYIENQH